MKIILVALSIFALQPAPFAAPPTKKPPAPTPPASLPLIQSARHMVAPLHLPKANSLPPRATHHAAEKAATRKMSAEPPETETHSIEVTDWATGKKSIQHYSGRLWSNAGKIIPGGTGGSR